MRKTILRSLKTTLMLVVPLLIISLIFAFLTAYAEKGARPEFWEIGNTLWWWIVTISTVGYGDFVPVTPLGKIFGSVVILSSILYFGLFVSEIGILLRSLTNIEKLGLRNIKKKNHVVILGHNSLTNGLIAEINKLTGANKDIVLVTDKIDTNEFDNIYFVKGNPLDPETLVQANIKDASSCIILADQNVNNPDAYTLVVANEVSKLNKNILILAELTDQDMKALFISSEIDFFLSEKKLIKSVINDTDVNDSFKRVLGL